MTTEININCGTLLKEVEAIAHAVERKSTIPVLLNILLSCDNGFVNLTATDLDLQIKTTFEADVKNSGSITIPAELFCAILKRLNKENDVTLSWADDSKINIKSNKSKFDILTLSAADYPSLDGDDKYACKFVIPSKQLAKMVERTAYAVSYEATRYYLNGINLCANDKHLILAATNGHMLAKNWCDKPEGAEDLPNIIIPNKTVEEIARSLKSFEGDVLVEASTNKIKLSFGNKTIVSKLIDGTFPDYERVIPAEGGVSGSIEKTACKESLALLSSLGTDGGAVKFTFSNETLTISILNPDKGHGVDVIDAVCSSDNFIVGFNNKYVLATLASFEAEKINFSIHDNTTAILLKEPEKNHISVIMPMRVS